MNTKKVKMERKKQAGKRKRANFFREDLSGKGRETNTGSVCSDSDYRDERTHKNLQHRSDIRKFVHDRVHKDNNKFQKIFNIEKIGKSVQAN